MTDRWWPVAGRSMWPLGPGMAVRVDPRTPIAVGDVVVFIAAEGGSVFAHRVHAVTPETLIPRGDTNAASDAPVPRSAVIGRVDAIRWRGRTCPLPARGPIAWAQRRVGLGWAAVAPWLRAHLRAGGIAPLRRRNDGLEPRRSN